jgi:SAM-dependent methyltransferase
MGTSTGDDVAALQRDYWERDQSKRRSHSHPAVRALFEPRVDYLAGLVPDASRASILDVGCGNAFMTQPLEERFGDAVGLDLSGAMLRASPGRLRVQASAWELPFADGSFDVVTCSHLLHHLHSADRVHAVRDMARVARDAVVLYEPNRNNLLMFGFGALKKEERMSLRFSPRYMRDLIGATGFAEQHVRVEGTLVPNKAPAAWAKVSRVLDNTPVRRLGFYVRAVARR